MAVGQVQLNLPRLSCKVKKEQRSFKETGNMFVNGRKDMSNYAGKIAVQVLIV